VHEIRRDDIALSQEDESVLEYYLTYIRSSLKSAKVCVSCFQDLARAYKSGVAIPASVMFKGAISAIIGDRFMQPSFGRISPIPDSDYEGFQVLEFTQSAHSLVRMAERGVSADGPWFVYKLTPMPVGINSAMLAVNFGSSRDCYSLFPVTPFSISAFNAFQSFSRISVNLTTCFPNYHTAHKIPVLSNYEVTHIGLAKPFTADQVRRYAPGLGYTFQSFIVELAQGGVLQGLDVGVVLGSVEPYGVPIAGYLWDVTGVLEDLSVASMLAGGLSLATVVASYSANVSTVDLTNVPYHLWVMAISRRIKVGLARDEAFYTSILRNGFVEPGFDSQISAAATRALNDALRSIANIANCSVLLSSIDEVGDLSQVPAVNHVASGDSDASEAFELVYKRCNSCHRIVTANGSQCRSRVCPVLGSAPYFDGLVGESGINLFCVRYGALYEGQTSDIPAIERGGRALIRCVEGSRCLVASSAHICQNKPTRVMQVGVPGRPGHERRFCCEVCERLILLWHASDRYSFTPFEPTVRFYLVDEAKYMALFTVSEEPAVLTQLPVEDTVASQIARLSSEGDEYKLYNVLMTTLLSANEYERGVMGPISKPWPSEGMIDNSYYVLSVRETSLPKDFKPALASNVKAMTSGMYQRYKTNNLIPSSGLYEMYPFSTRAQFIPADKLVKLSMEEMEAMVKLLKYVRWHSMSVVKYLTLSDPTDYQSRPSLSAWRNVPRPLAYLNSRFAARFIWGPEDEYIKVPPVVASTLLRLKLPLAGAVSRYSVIDNQRVVEVSLPGDPPGTRPFALLVGDHIFASAQAAQSFNIEFYAGRDYRRCLVFTFRRSPMRDSAAMFCLSLAYRAE